MVERVEIHPIRITEVTSHTDVDIYNEVEREDEPEFSRNEMMLLGVMLGIVLTILVMIAAFTFLVM